MAPDDLQALLWYHEKGIWDKNKWTGSAGATKSSFDDEASKLNVERYQMGLTTFRTQKDFNENVFKGELEDMRKAVGELDGVVISRVEKSNGLYGAIPEPAFDIEFSVNKGSNISPAVKKGIEVSVRERQKDFFVSKVVDMAHPNARPMLELGFKSAASEKQVSKVIKALQDNGMDGFTIARNSRGEAIGIRSQFIPEISARFDSSKKMAYLSGADEYNKLAKAWSDNMEAAIKEVSDMDNISYAEPGHVSTIVYGIEEYLPKLDPKVTQNAIDDLISRTNFDSNLTEQLSRRAGILDIPQALEVGNTP